MFQEKPQIAVFSLAYAPFEGGAEIAAREIIKRLSVLNFSIFTLKFDKNWASCESAGNYEIFRVGKGSRGDKYGWTKIFAKIFYVFAAWRAAEKMHKQKKFDVVWSVMASYSGPAALFFKLRHPSVPLLLTLQEGDSKRHLYFGKFGMVGLWSKLVILKSDYIQTISNFLKDLAKKHGARCPVEVVPNGVDLELFSGEIGDEKINEVKQRLGIENEKIIVTTSRLVYKNGVDILIRAVAELKNKILVKCLIVGGGPEREKLGNMVKDLELDGQVIFIGQIMQKDLPMYLGVSDVFVRASRSEGLGNSFLESMAARVPVIGTDVGGIKDFLTDGVTGFCVKSEDVKNLAEKIEYVLENEDITSAVVKNAFELVKNNFSFEVVAKNMERIFDKLIIK